jgi:hypothetical protein
VRLGAAWCPTNNKFYCGIGENGTARAVKIDPLLDFSAELITGFSPTGNGGHTIWNPAAGEIWLQAGGGGVGIIRINPAGDTLTNITCNTPTDLTYCSANSSVYTSGGSIQKISSGGSVSTLFTLADFEVAWGGPAPGASFGAIEYVDSLGLVLFFISYPSGGYAFAWQIDTTTDAVTPYAGGVGGLWMYYSPEFDKIILNGGSQTVSFNTDFTLSAVLGTDMMSARKGCYCDNISKMALPVLTGDPGSRYYTVKFYDAADL